MENIKSIIEISELIAREISGELNEFEKESLNHWLNSSERNQIIYRQIVEGKNLPERNSIYQSIDVNQAWGKMSESLTDKHKERPVRNFFFRYAAAVLLVAGLGAATYYLIPHQSDIEQFAATPDERPENAVLILADGKRVEIDNKQSKIEFCDDGSGIVLNDSSTITQPVSEEGFNQMIVPYGKRSFITLSEGTKVWLNSGSKLIFPPSFKGKTREVILEGEAFFDVAHNAEKPFYVKTDAFRMKVYGTKFNVQAYRQDQDYNIVLVEGKVSMNSNSDLQAKEVFLAPNQKASIIKGDEKIDVTTVESTDIYTAWVDGYLIFSNEELADLLERVSRYYNAEIEIEPNTNMETIYGKLDLKDDLERVLDGIAFISKTSYIKQGDKYIFKTN